MVKKKKQREKKQPGCLKNLGGEKVVM